MGELGTVIFQGLLLSFILMLVNCAFNLLTRKATSIAAVNVGLNILQGQTTTLQASEDGDDIY